MSDPVSGTASLEIPGSILFGALWYGSLKHGAGEATCHRNAARPDFVGGSSCCLLSSPGKLVTLHSQAQTPEHPFEVRLRQSRPQTGSGLRVTRG